jgi:hypothetical protein
MIKSLLIFILFSTSSVWSQDLGCTMPNLSYVLPFNLFSPPLELIEVHQEDYERNNQATFCTRPIEMVDTVVIHHSETSPGATPQQINRYHLNRGTPDDPWYMIAYSYVVNAPYAGTSFPLPRVTEGRPLEIVGAHAGSNAFVSMDEEQARLFKEGKVVCGKEGGEFKVDPSMIKDGKIKANATTLGLVVLGNYAPYNSRHNPGGYSRSYPRLPAKDTLDMIARLSCQLQKKHPRIKNIKWHNFYNTTSCPGNLRNYIDDIKSLTKRYGCDFQ